MRIPSLRLAKAVFPTLIWSWRVVRWEMSSSEREMTLFFLNLCGQCEEARKFDASATNLYLMAIGSSRRCFVPFVVVLKPNESVPTRPSCTLVLSLTVTIYRDVLRLTESHPRTSLRRNEQQNGREYTVSFETHG